jgi:hypothetical protein
MTLLSIYLPNLLDNEKLIEHDNKSTIKLINSPFTNPKRYPEINKQ